jgi:hypothetical protein
MHTFRPKNILSFLLENIKDDNSVHFWRGRAPDRLDRERAWTMVKVR